MQLDWLSQTPQPSQVSNFSLTQNQLNFTSTLSPTAAYLYYQSLPSPPPGAMHLMYTLDKDGNRIYTLKKVTAEGAITKSAHPARFSPDDKYSRHRVTLKKRYGVLMTQQECKPW